MVVACIIMTATLSFCLCLLVQSVGSPWQQLLHHFCRLLCMRRLLCMWCLLCMRRLLCTWCSYHRFL
jgi:hypothetical protein